VVAILVILIAIAGPDFRNMIVATRIKNASFDVFSALVHARSEAVTRNSTVLVCRGTNWTSGWTVTSAADCSSITTANTISTHGVFQGFTITDAPTSASISFNGMGRASPSVSFSIDAPGAIERNKRCIIIDASGRPVTKEGTCS
jgi:type IV fimbrial biogenesis protein FimT